MNKKRQAIWDKSGGKCWYCGCDLPEKGWHADHYYPIVRKLIERRDPQGILLGYTTGKECFYPELDTKDNLVPSCAPCNTFKSSLHPESYRSSIASQFENTLKASSGLRQLKRMGLIDIEPKEVQFWFEKNGLSVKSEMEMIGISKEASETEWLKDNSEPNYFYQWIKGNMITLRHMGEYWLAICVTKEWDSSRRTELPNGRNVKAQAAEWALRLNR